MKPRPTQFGVRENTASSRQHAPRLSLDTRSTAICTEEETPETQRSSSFNEPQAAGSENTLPAASQRVTTGGERRDESSLLTVHEVADLLQVPVSWVYQHTRPHCAHSLPHLKLGKYLRFRSIDITNYLDGTQSVHRVSR